MITPSSIKIGELIGIVSPAKKIEKTAIENAVKIINNSGFKVKLGKYALGSQNYFAGSDDQRAEDFQQMLDDPDVKMILCSRGGYGVARIIDRLNFLKFMKTPKWIAGYSDITVFHSHLFNLGFESLHSIMPLDFSENGLISKPVQMLLDAASGKPPEYNFLSHNLNRSGKTNGILVGGNLSIICSLLGSKSDVDTTGKILFLEEVGEEHYRLDRMMVTLKRANKLKSLSGLLVGGLTGMSSGNPDFGRGAEEIILDAVLEYDYPVAFGFPAGHFAENYPLIIGRKVQMDVDESVAIKFEDL